MNTVIFDIGKVLVEYDWKIYLEELHFSEDAVRAVADAVFLSPEWQKADEGIVTPENWLSVFQKNAPGYEKEIEKVYQTLEGCITSYEETPALIQHFRRKGWRIFYLSNYSEYLYQKTQDKLSFLRDFDGGVFSFQEKCLKPEEKIYRILLKRYSIKPEDALFLDDRPENIEAARRLGMQGIVCTREAVHRLLTEKD